MKTRAAITPAALVVLAAGTAAYAFFVDRGAVSDAERAARRSDVFPSFRVEEVTRVELEHGAEVTVLERAGASASAGAGAPALWTMTSPRQERADAAAVDVLLRDLELARRVREVAPRDALGLDAPRVRGRVRVGKLEYRFALGADAPVPVGAAYMRVEGEGSFVVDRALVVQLLRAADAYRDHAVLPFGSGGVGKLEVRPARGPGYALERHGTSFRVAGTEMRASRSTVDRLLLAFADARAESFVDEAVAERMLAAADADHGPSGDVGTLRVTIEPRDDPSARVELRVGGACPGDTQGVVVLRTAPSRIGACAARTLIDALAAPMAAATLVDTSPLFARADEIEELRLEGVGHEGPRVDVARRGSGWHERSPEDRELDADASESVSALVLALARARATSARRPTPDERFEARARVTVVRTGAGATEVVEVGVPAADGTTPVRRLDDGALLPVPRAIARRFEPHPAALRARTPWATPFDAAAITAIDDSCGPAPERLELHDGTWSLRAPAGQAVDNATIVDLTGALAKTKAEGYVAEADDESFGLRAPDACAVTVTLAAAAPGPARRQTMTFGAPSEGGYYARTGEEPSVFVAPASLRHALVRPAIDRAPVRVRLGGGAVVTIVHDGARRELGPAFDDGDRLANALLALRAQSAVHAGPPAPNEGFDDPRLEIRVGTPAGGAAAGDATTASATATDAGITPTRILVGAAAHLDEGDAYYARVAGVDATFAIPEAAVRAVVDAL
jgi:hypothetical protein